jgi:YD repeat-containing protein
MSSIHTQAGNFLDFLKTGVDNRTGQFTLAITLPLPPANQLRGPALSITLAFSVLGSSVSQGYGLGWTFGLSDFDLKSLRLGSGEQYAIDQDASTFAVDTPLTFIDQKLKTLRVTPQANGDYRVDKQSGDCEILREQDDSGRYLVEEMHAPEGHRLFIDWLPYHNGHSILECIRDEQRDLLQVESLDDEVQLILHPHTPHAAVLRLVLSNDRLVEVHFPGIDPPLRIDYLPLALDDGSNLLLPCEVHSPLGAVDLVTWATGSDGHHLPPGAPLQYLPCVNSWVHCSGPADDSVIHDYQWIGKRNFLGFGSAQAFSWEHGRDNLYQVEAEYQYQMVETLSDARGNVLDTISQVWNRFHLPILQSSKRGDCEVSTCTTYGIDPSKTWEAQGSTCQLPHQVSTTYIHHAHPGMSRRETTTYHYDEHGNITQVRYPSAIHEVSQYYPAEGAPGCPADPLGRVRFLRQKTIHPADADSAAPTLNTSYTYRHLQSLTPGVPGPIVVECECLVDAQDNRPLKETRHTYAEQPGIAYGQVVRSVTTLNGKSTTTEYEYHSTADERVCRTTLIGFENDALNRSSTIRAQSLLTGQTTWERSASDALTHYEYDLLGRIVCTRDASASPYQVERRVNYHLGDALAKAMKGSSSLPPMMIEQVDVSGRRQRLWLDGDGRTRRIELEDLDNEPGHFREVMHNAFDALGRQVSQTTLDWLAPNATTPLSLTTTTAFDDWGQVAITLGPDGVHTHERHDPITRRSERWQGAGTLCGPRQATLHNAAGSPVEQRLYDATGQLVRQLELVRDGLDRVVEERVLVAGAPAQITQYRHDQHSRVIEKHLADDTTVAWQFAAHSDDQHIEAISITPSEQETTA